MKSSTGRFRWLMITLFIVLMAACLGFSMFFMACKGGDSTENPPVSSEENPDDGGEEKETTVESVVLSSSELSLTVGGSTEITVTVTMKEGYETVDFTYAVDANGIITVTQSGDTLTVQADAAGSATITVSADGVSATCKVTVSAGSSSSEDKEYEDVSTAFPYDQLAEYYATNEMTVGSTKLSEDVTFGKFVLGSGNRYDSDGTINTQGANPIYITLSGEYNPETGKEGNSISFTMTGASSSGDTEMKLYVLGDNGEYTEVENSTWYAGRSSGETAYEKTVNVSVDDLPAGTYKLLGNSYSCKISNLKINEYLEISDIVSISATITTKDFLMGRTISESNFGIVVTLEYENGKTEAVTYGFTTDITTITIEPGENKLTVTYSNDDGEWDAEVSFYVYVVSSIEISDFSMELTGGVYYTNNVQKVFLVGDEINYDNAAVTAYATYTEGSKEYGTSFILKNATEVIFSDNADMTQTGTYTVTASVNIGLSEGTVKTSTYTIHVVDAADANITTVNVVHPTENADGTETEVATYAADSDGIISVSTISDAIMLIKLMGATDAERKYIYVGEGQYWEKIYIDIPNLSLIGSNPTTSDGGTEGDLLGTRSEVTEIVYDAMNGIMDPSGSTNYSTVGSATVTVASQATGFYAANITFRNYWNTNALYNESRTYTSDTQADAAYINADKAHFYNVTFTGYHDTLEAENGRQYYENCYIEGRTDYIFGNTATCYFYQCNIHTIGGGSSTNGGYVTAVKGGSMTYGYVFDGCNFTSDLKSYYTDEDGNETVPYEGFAYTEEGTVSLGRTWSSSDMHVAVINSTLDAGYSKTAYGTSGKNPRYASMSGYAPTESYLVEYGNTGDGAITETLSGTCSVLTDASGYTMENIFSSTNGSLYSDNWNPSIEKTITVTVKSGETAVGVIYATDSISIEDLTKAINARLSETEVIAIYSDSNLTAEITDTITASTTVYIAIVEKDMSVTETTYWDFTMSQYGDSISTSKYIDADQKIYLNCPSDGSALVKNDKYYKLDGGATLTLILNAGSTLGIGVYDLTGLVLKDADGNDITSSGTYCPSTVSNNLHNYLYTYQPTSDGEAITISQGTVSTLYLIYINVMFPVTETTIIQCDDGDTASIEGTYGWFKSLYIDATNSGKFDPRSQPDTQINANTIVYVYTVPGATAEVNYRSGSDGTSTTIENVDENGVIKITFGAQVYILSITVTVPTT